MAKRELSTVAKAAKMIRQDLKKHFPNIKFSVQSENYSMGDSIRVKYQNGVPTADVEKIIGKYQYGHFDGMTDSYDYSNKQDFPQTKYLFVSREVDQEIKDKVKAELAQRFGIKNPEDESEWMKTLNQWPDQVVFREMQDKTY